ncbi:helix-turn-helix domain-containing protein [candidate division KSB1 bacterium]|nr:helix-turn-helix domain-containing protein [candidate division KSB1 bacterium]
MPGRAPIFPDRIRKIRGSFSWIEHRFVHDGFLRALSGDELLLYYFLVTVGDRNGISYYDYEKICQLLKLEVEAYIRARDGLIARQLIAYQQGVFQVLPLPVRPSLPRLTTQVPGREGDFHALAEIFKRLEATPAGRVDDHD